LRVYEQSKTVFVHTKTRLVNSKTFIDDSYVVDGVVGGVDGHLWVIG